MLGVFYLILAGMLGKEIAEGLPLRGAKGREKAWNRLWLMLPASFGAGTLILTWGIYGLAWCFCVFAGAESPLFYGNLIGLPLAFAACLLLRRRRLRRGKRSAGDRPGSENSGGSVRTMVSDPCLLRKEAFFFLILFAFLLGMFFYVFHVYQGVLYSGYTVYGDYAPHTAMMRSFSWGDNFPTQYPHFGGEDVKYHFMFQFLVGNLEYLGMRLDIAYNLVSAVSLLGFLMLLYMLCRRLGGGLRAGIFATAFFFWRSGTAFFQFAAEHIRSGDFLAALAENASFLGYSPNENWGMWNFNVYLNQRHFAFGLLLAALAVWVFWDWLEAAAAQPVTGAAWIKGRFVSVDAWRCRDPKAALLLGVLLGLCAFWNGAVVIGVLLILAGFGIFSDGKLDYAVTGGTAAVLSWLQTKFFISGSGMSFSFYFGFLAEEKTLWGVIEYLFQISGFFFLGLFVLAVFLRRRERTAILALCFPVLFAFTMSLTPDINVNHKYVMISYAFLTAFWGCLLARLTYGRWWKRCAAVLLTICLVTTGVYDFVVILRGNDEYHRVGVRMESSLSDWLRENLDSRDLILTPEYSINEVTMAGVMMYCGWPYYAWSAGYDTYYRAARATEMYSTGDPDILKRLVKEEGITYILFEEGSEFEGVACREDVIASVYTRVFISDDGRIRIYEV